jgi:hypothetical protein
MEINKNIPVPDRKKYPFCEMEKDESVFFNSCIATKAKNASRVYGHRYNKKFTSRKQPCGGVRIWRVA